MAQLLVRFSELDRDWTAIALLGKHFRLSANAAGEVACAAGSAQHGTRLWYDESLDRWLLLAEPSANVRRNGDRVLTGIAALDHKDEVRIAKTRCYFSNERRARIERYDASDEPRCPRCARGIESGQHAVRCPSCGVVHHEEASDSNWKCWTHADRCAVCDCETGFDSELRWIPGEA